MSDARTILEFRDVSTAADRFVGAMTGVSFRLRAAEAALVLMDRDGEDPALCDVAEGLREPRQGVVEFLGRAWKDMSFFRQSQLRGRIGRVFDAGGWISNLTVYENISLSERHHTGRADGEIRQECERLAEQAGLAGSLDVRPHLLRESERRRGQWVRAFLGGPRLLLLDRPAREVPAEHLAPLFGMVSGALSRGAALLWLTDDTRIADDGRTRGWTRLRFRSGRMTHGG